MRVLRARLLRRRNRNSEKQLAQERKSQVGSGDRSERIRTYISPRAVTDHRIGMTIYKLEQFLDGEIDEIVDALITNAQAEQLKKVDDE